MNRPGSEHQVAGQVGMDRAPQNQALTVDVGDELSDLAAEELQYILDGVRLRHTGAPPEAILRELQTFRRVRELHVDIVRRLAEDISARRTAHARA
jgi:hypothetical protein